MNNFNFFLKNPENIYVKTEQIDELITSINLEMDNTNENLLTELKELNKKLCLIKCIVCNRMLENDKLTTLAPKQLENEILINAVKNFDEIQSDTKLYICRDQCYNQIFIHKKIPIYSHLNKMELIDPPQVISKLNLFERLLIQRAKCFQTIVKLKPYTKFTGQEYVSALKGIAVHLPLSLNATNKYIIDTLPNLNSLNVIINSLPTKSANVWRALVNLDSIYKVKKKAKLNFFY